MQSKKLGWLLLSPTLVVLFLFGVLPFVYVVYVSFHQWNPFAANPDMVFNGADNFRRAVFDAGFLSSLGVTIAFVFFAVTTELLIGYALAQAFMRDFPGKAFFRTIHTLPLIMAPIIVGSIWKLMTTPSIGVVPHLLDSWFGYNLNIGQSAAAAFTVIVMDVWHWTSLVALLAYAGLQSIPDAYYQAAKIDQASRWKVFRYIELPKMMGVLMIAILLRFMDSFMIYTEPFVVTGGGPGNSTTFLSIDLVKMALGQFDLGPAAAFSIMYYLVILLISYVFYTVMTNLDKRDGH
ncbi:hypothetical protein LCGC14_0301430 [marine sediment metagenome]|uniref:ABC transmembrane type-1 domain-containing protein n=1 Tax=marine sediment metagenome TaxID=412755 RepID=A0A0F9TQ00_9ZZZZ